MRKRVYCHNPSRQGRMQNSVRIAPGLKAADSAIRNVSQGRANSTGETLCGWDGPKDFESAGVTK